MMQTSLALTQSEDEEEYKQTKTFGIQAILSSALFSNRTSQLYLTSFKTYFDSITDPEVLNLLKHHDPNLHYSVNCSYLWKLLKYKVKQFNSTNSALKLFANEPDRRIIEYSFKVASIMALNDGYEKVIDPDQAPLRQNLKDYMWKNRKNELKRKKDVQKELDSSIFFREFVPKKMELLQSQSEQLKEDLLQVKMTPLLRKYFGTVQSYLHQVLSFIRESLNKTTDNHQKEAYKMMLLYIYLKIYLANPDWLNTINHQKNEGFYFNRIVEKNGFNIIKRFVDDAPIQIIKKEIMGLRQIY